jgi:hypothetical protein
VLEGAVDVRQLLLNQAALQGLLPSLNLLENFHCMRYLG